MAEPTNVNVKAAIAAAVATSCELRHLLNECVASVHEPIRFLACLNAFIQAARNVTFRIQNFKSEVDGFDEWYAPWQAWMKQDPFMLWLKGARNKIVKERGLHSLSAADVTFTSSYSERDAAHFDLPPMMTTQAIVDAVHERVTHPSDIFYGVIEIDRRWTLEDLPDADALVVVCEVHRACDCLLHDFVTRHCQGEPVVLPADALAQWAAPFSAEELADFRTLRIETCTGKEAGAIRVVTPTLPPQGLVEEHYADLPVAHPESLSDDPVERVQSLMPLACAILEKDGCHASMFQLRHRERGWQIVEVEFPDRTGKYRIIHELADYCREQDIDALIFMGETWILPRSIAALPVIPPTDYVEAMPDKKEALTFIAAAADGTVRCWMVPFAREGEKILCGLATDAESGGLSLIDPIRAVWGLPPASAPSTGGSASP